MNVSFNGVGDKLVTFLNDGAEKGQVVKVSGAGTVAPCADGDAFDGVAAFVDGGYAGVHLRGFVTVAYSGASVPGVGHTKLAANGDGGVKVAASGKEYLVVGVDGSAKLVTILM